MLKPSNHRRPGRRSPLRQSLVLVTRHNIMMLNLWRHNPNTKALLFRPKWLMRGSIIFTNSWIKYMITSTMPFPGKIIWPLWRSKAKQGKRWTICYPLCTCCSSKIRLFNNLLRLYFPRPLFLSFLKLNCVWKNLGLYNLFVKYFYVFVNLYINLFLFLLNLIFITLLFCLIHIYFK